MNKTAFWHISLDCTCPSCGMDFDISDHDDELFHQVQPAEDKKDYGVACPFCEHEFNVDMVY